LRGARNLVNKDTIGKSDPYCVTVVGSRSFKTKTIDDNLNPVWDQFYEVPLYNSAGLSVDFHVWDKDVKNDESLGSLCVSISQVEKESFMDIWSPLSDIKKGEIQVQLQYCKLMPHIAQKSAEDIKRPGSSGDKCDIPQLTRLAQDSLVQFGPHVAPENFSRCYINVFVDSASNLPRNHPTDLRAYPSPYVKISIAGSAEKQSSIMKDMMNPVWEEGFDFLINNTPDKIVKCDVMDSEKNSQYFGVGQAQAVLGQVGLTQSTHTTIGTVKVFVNDILESSNMTLEMPFQIEGTIESQLLLKITARFVVQRDPAGEDSSEASNDVTHPDVNDSSVALSEDAYWEEGHRKLGSSTGNLLTRDLSGHPVPKLCLKFRYLKDKNKLIVEVFKAEGLLAEKLYPYVSLKLMPDNVKRKTDSVKIPSGSSAVNLLSMDSVEWNKTFDFNCPLSEITNKTITATVKNNSGFGKSDIIFGYVCIPLYTMHLEHPLQSWFLITSKPEPTPMLKNQAFTSE